MDRNRKPSDVPSDMEQLIDKARDACRSVSKLATSQEMMLSDPQISLALVRLAKAVGIIINGLALVSAGAGEALRNSDAARITMKNVGQSSRESLETYKNEINMLKQRVTELEGAK